MRRRCRFLPGVLLVLLLIGPEGWARYAAADTPPAAPPPPPRLFALFPPGAQRGKTVTVTLDGENLHGLTGFFTEARGISAQVLPLAPEKNDADKQRNSKIRTVQITVAPDAPPGIQQLRFFDPASGLSNVRYFQVGQWPETNETEPNDTPEKAQRVTLPVTINGRIAQNPDRDGFTFHAKAGERIVCEIDGLRLLGQVGDSWLKGYLEITDAGGKTLAQSEGVSDDYYRWDPLIIFTPPTEGDYTVYFRDLNWRGDVRSVYRLTLGTMAHSRGIFPLGGRRGETTTVGFVGPGCDGGATVPVTPPADDPEGLPLPVALTTSSGGITNARPFQVDDLPEVLQKEGNHTLAAAQSVPFPCVVNGRLTAGERDCYRLHVEKKQSVVLEVFSRRLGTPVDPEMLLYNASGGLMQADDDGRGTDCWISRDLDPGDYTLAVRDIQDRGGPEWSYRLSLAPPRPALFVVVTPDAPLLKRGGAPVKLPVTIRREYGWDEPVTITLTNPPPGIEAAPLTIPRGKSDGELTITTAKTALPGSVRLRFLGAAIVNGKPVRTWTARTSETYNIQGTAFQRDLPGPIAFVAD